MRVNIVTHLNQYYLHKEEQLEWYAKGMPNDANSGCKNYGCKNYAPKMVAVQNYAPKIVIVKIMPLNFKP